MRTQCGESISAYAIGGIGETILKSGKKRRQSRETSRAGPRCLNRTISTPLAEKPGSLPVAKIAHDPNMRTWTQREIRRFEYLVRIGIVSALLSNLHSCSARRTRRKKVELKGYTFLLCNLSGFCAYASAGHRSGGTRGRRRSSGRARLGARRGQPASSLASKSCSVAARSAARPRASPDAGRGSKPSVGTVSSRANGHQKEIVHVPAAASHVERSGRL